VIVEADLSETGAVTDARVLSGPPELRRAALASVLDWHFSRETVAAPRLQIAIQFQLPPGEPGAIAIPAADSDRNLGVLKQINVAPDVPAPARGVLPLKVGDTLTPAKLEQALAELVRIDEHLDLQIRAVEGGQAVRIRMAERNAGVPGGGGAPQRIRVGGNVQQTKLLEKKVPKYPPEAKAAGIQGTVKLMAVIGKDGRVKTLEVLSGDPLLASAALEAVKEWVYSTTHLNGEPVEVATQIDIHFTLNQ
jgi:protein TonB